MDPKLLSCYITYLNSDLASLKEFFCLVFIFYNLERDSPDYSVSGRPMVGSNTSSSCPKPLLLDPPLLFAAAPRPTTFFRELAGTTLNALT